MTEPTLSQKALNYAKSTLKHARAGFKRVPNSIWRIRIGICRDNCKMYIPKREVCKHKKCGCKITRKAYRATESCPLGKW